jgi:hypothetical protein
MWHRLKNFVHSLKTYRELSPDLCIRQRVVWALSDRPLLSVSQWYRLQCHPRGISRPIAEFTYLRLSQYSGLPFGRVLLSDRLETDLHWTEICWHDWHYSLHEDFLQQFEIDLGDRLFEINPTTVAELMQWLDQALQSTL